MNIERGTVNTVLVPGRKLADEYTLRFTRVLDQSIVSCITSNVGHVHGPLLLPFEEKSTPSDPDDVSLIVGDHILQVLIAIEEGGGDFNDDFNEDFLTIGGTTYREVWSEQVRVD